MWPSLSAAARFERFGQVVRCGQELARGVTCLTKRHTYAPLAARWQPFTLGLPPLHCARDLKLRLQMRQTAASKDTLMTVENKPGSP